MSVNKSILPSLSILKNNAKKKSKHLKIPYLVALKLESEYWFGETWEQALHNYPKITEDDFEIFISSIFIKFINKINETIEKDYDEKLAKSNLLYRSLKHLSHCSELQVEKFNSFLKHESNKSISKEIKLSQYLEIGYKGIENVMSSEDSHDFVLNHQVLKIQSHVLSILKADLDSTTMQYFDIYDYMKGISRLYIDFLKSKNIKIFVSKSLAFDLCAYTDIKRFHYITIYLISEIFLSESIFISITSRRISSSTILEMRFKGDNLNNILNETNIDVIKNLAEKSNIHITKVNNCLELYFLNQPEIIFNDFSNILYLDDNLLSQKIFSKVAHKHKFNVISADSYKNIILLSEIPHCYVIIDNEMLNFDISLVLKIIKLKKESKIVILNNKSTCIENSFFYEKGADLVLEKPFSLNDIFKFFKR